MRTTHIATVRKEKQTQRQRVCELLMWTNDDYCNFQFEAYQAFFKALFSQYPELHKEVEYSPIVRGWFNLEWADRDQDWLAFAEADTEDYLEVDADGQLLVLPGTPYGHKYLVGEYMHCNAVPTLQNDGAFMHRYLQTLKLLR